VNLERRTAREVFADFEAFEAKLGLQSTGSGYTRHPLQGGEARYFAPRETDSSWFDKQVVPAILSVTAGDFYIDLTARTGVHGRNTHSWQVIDRWRQFVIENWAEIVDLRAYLSGPGLTLTFNYDNFRERATLDIRTPTKEASDKLVAQFVSQLGLESLGDAQHWHFRTTALYSVSIITNEVFASEVRKLVHLLFPGKYLLNQARVLEPLNEKQGEEEKQTIVQFTALDEFLTRLGSDKAYSEAILQLEGPRGKNLYVGLTNKLTKLEIRSSERPGDFSQILKNLESRLSLTVVSVTPSVTDKRPLKESAWVLIALPVATAFATGTIFSDTFRTWITAKPKLEITSPPKSSGSPPAPATVSETFEVRWQVQTETFGKKEHIEQSNATFHINKDGIDVVTKVCVPSGGTVKLDRPGKYHIRINSCDYGGDGDKTEFEVK
jgi:hypothetical protein